MSYTEKRNIFSGKAEKHKEAKIKSLRNKIGKSVIKPGSITLEDIFSHLYNLYREKHQPQFSIPDDFIAFRKHTNQTISPNFNHRCYKTALELAKSDSSLKLVLGLSVNKNTAEAFVKSNDPEFPEHGGYYVTPYPHAWNINENNEIMDYTYGYESKNYIYFGFIVDDTKLKHLVDEKDVESYLIKMWQRRD